MSFVDYGYDEDFNVELPCEFCNQPFPMYLLIEHETTHLNGDVIYPEFDDPIADTVTVETRKIEQPKVAVEKQIENSYTEQPKVAVEKQIENSYTEPKVAVEQKQTQNSHTEPKVPSVTLPPESLKVASKNVEIKQNQFKKFHTQAEEFTTKTGEKLLVYGADIDPVEDLDTEKQSYKMPNNPMMSNIPKEEDIEDINNLSDDDCEESLEEFWKRARDLLKRNRSKTEC